MKITTQTRLYCVMGNPVGHSLSPAMHNAALETRNINAVYLAFEVRDIHRAVQGIRSMGIAGASVTIPHKISIMEYLDRVDPMAVDIGAVNTVKNENGKLIGFNTDAPAAVQALCRAMNVVDKTVAVIGAGGAAKAVAYGLKAAGSRVVVVNRTREKGEALARGLNADFLPLEDSDRLNCHALVNTTPVGMAGKPDRLVISPKCLNPDMVVMDIVYNPIHTPLLKQAKNMGCKTVDGVWMFVYQGAMQFELWTQTQAPVDVMTSTVRRILEADE